MSDLVHEAAKHVVSAIAEKEGLTLDAEQVVSFAEQGAQLLADLITGRVREQAQVDADAAAAKITTLEQAEKAEKEP